MNHYAQEYFPLDELEKFPTVGDFLAKTHFGVVESLRHEGEHLIVKIMNLEEVRENFQQPRSLRRNDHPPNEIFTHRYLLEGTFGDCQGVLKPSPYIIQLKAVTMSNSENKVNKENFF